VPVSEDLGVSIEELALAARNHGMPLEALAYDVTPVGLHYLLIHYDIPKVAEAGWRLTVDGAVGRSLSLSLDEIRDLPAVTQRVTMECAGNGRARLRPRPVSQPWLFEAVGTSEWTGVLLSEILEESGLAAEAVEVLFTGLDRGVEGGSEQTYQRSLSREEAGAPEVMLAYAMNGEPLLPQHGFPLRLLVPGWYGMTSVKWLDRITALREPFDGYQQSHSYRIRVDDEDPGEAVTRILPRSLMMPPGIPEFATRSRLVPAGEVEIQGRAWSGYGAIQLVEFSSDGGDSWQEAEVEDRAQPHAWQGWRYRWDATPASYLLCSRATDETGRTQPSEPVWNLGGYEINAVQRVPVEVTEPVL
jgi:sulfane dehydrogenase subunit SoxC